MGRISFLIISMLFLWLNQSIVCANVSCVTGKGNIVTESRDLHGFTEVEVLGSMDVQIVSGDKYSLQVTDYENLLPLLKTELSGNKLEIKFDGCVRNSRAKVKITMPELKGVFSSGSGDITISGEFKAGEDVSISSLGSGDIIFNGLLDGSQRLVVSAKGSGNIRINTVGEDLELKFSSLGSGDAILNIPGSLKNLDVVLSGSGDLTVKGDTITDAQIRMLGSGDCDAGGVVVKNLTIKVMGSGDAEVSVSEALNAKILGSGDVVYHGNPKSIDLSKMGSGSVVKR